MDSESFLPEFRRLHENNRAAFREWVQAEIAPHVEQGERECRLPDQVRTAMAGAGCFGRTLDSRYGGLGDRFSGWAIQQEELGRVWASAAVASTWTNLSGLLLQRFADASWAGPLLVDMAVGRQLGAVGWTEPGGGSDAAALQTTATRVDGGWRLDGSKRLIDNVAAADFVVVGARTSADPREGISMFLLRRDDPGLVDVATFDMLGLRPAGVGHFRLQDCRLPADRLVGSEGGGLRQMMTMVETGRTGVAAITLGMAESALESAVSFLRDRRFFSRPLSRNEAVLARIGELRARLAAARSLTYAVAAQIDAGEGCAERAAMAKLFTSETAAAVIGESMHLHGGIGLTSGEAVQRQFRDIHGFTIGEGTSEVMRFVIGRAEFGR